ncbi:MAG: HAMP domain-containing histidine kinase [Epsilonproteobacteria bacterium]|nr:HAMP domain-containing histidine kinase [Campylobacterota bacterium]
MLSSERRSLVRFLVIYLASTLLLFSLASWIFYSATKHHLLDKQRESLKYEAESIKSALRHLHQSNTIPLPYPYHSSISSAIFDLDREYIFGTFPKPITLEGQRESDTIYYESKIEPYYLGAAYLLTVKKIDFVPIENLRKNIFLFMFAAGVFFSVLGYFLGKLFVAPMRDSITRMNHFIQDTTHELNTPISTILTNIEMIETFGNHEENNAEFKRIEIASKTLSRIYDDLTYLNLNHHYHRHIISADMSALVQERVVYFTGMIEAKNLNLVLELEEDVILEMDKNDALRLIDNLISNAIKYNKHQGVLHIVLTQSLFAVRDTGIGISKKDLGGILQRFQRANKSEGGFGIGLDIVSQVVKSYAYTLKINSILHVGTEVSVTWEK